MRIQIASTLFSRMRGLLSERICANGEILMLVPCSSIHTFGMREPIDLAFLDREGTVLKAQRALRSRSFASCKGALCVLERRSDPATGWFRAGEQIKVINGIAKNEDSGELGERGESR